MFAPSNLITEWTQKSCHDYCSTPILKPSKHKPDQQRQWVIILYACWFKLPLNSLPLNTFETWFDWHPAFQNSLSFLSVFLRLILTLGDAMGLDIQGEQELECIVLKPVCACLFSWLIFDVAVTGLPLPQHKGCCQRNWDLCGQMVLGLTVFFCVNSTGLQTISRDLTQFSPVFL